MTNRLSKLKRPSTEFPRRFVRDDLDFSDWNNLESLFTNLLERKINSVEALEQWLLDESETYAVISEEGSRRKIATSCATNDTEAEKAFLYFVENIHPKISPLSHLLNLKENECRYLEELNRERYEVEIRNLQNSIDLFREENIPLGVEVTKLNQQYQKILGMMTVEYNGREHTIQQMRVHLEDKDRALREKVWRLLVERRLEETEKLDELFDKMLSLRIKIAKNAGFDDYPTYIFRAKNRFDYTPDDCVRFHDSIERYALPLVQQMAEEKRRALNIDPLKPWDMGCDQYGRDPLKPFKDVDKLVGGCREIFGRIDAELGDNFQTMIDLGLLDLESRKGKRPGGFQLSLPEVRLPFIFMNAVGLDHDVFTLLHEGGHAFHQFAIRREPLLTYRHSPMEFAEVASMSMELMGAYHLEVFYDPANAARARRGHFENTIGMLPSVALIDAFQHWIYTHPEGTSEDRANYWKQLSERFSSGVDWTGFEDAKRTSWHTIHHIYGQPFYYIEYGIAQLGAIQVWCNSRKDKSSALNAYKEGLSLGGSRPLPEIFNTAGISFDFSDSIVEPMMKEATSEVERQGQLERK